MTLFTSLLDINIPHWKTVSSGFTHNLLKRRVDGERWRFNIEQITFGNELSWFENQNGIVTVYCLVLGSMMASFTSKLKEKDEFLYNRIKELDLKPQYYAFRWLTLLLSQEFPLPGTILKPNSLYMYRTLSVVRLSVPLSSHTDFCLCGF